MQRLRSTAGAAEDIAQAKLSQNTQVNLYIEIGASAIEIAEIFFEIIG